MKILILHNTTGVGSSLCALNPAVRFALPELELGTVVEEEPEDLDYRRQKETNQPELQNISWISRNLFKVINSNGVSMILEKFENSKSHH